MILNYKNKDPVEIWVGETKIKQGCESKLLGIKIEDSQQWNNQIKGKGGIISSLNQRLYFIRRLKRQLNQDKISKVVDSIRYGVVV